MIITLIARGGWDEQSDLDMIIIHPAADDDDDRRKTLGRVLADLKERHYPGYRDHNSSHHGVMDGLMIETLQNYRAGCRTLNHVLARAAREGRVFTRDLGTEDSYRHDGDVSNEWEMVTRERLWEAHEANRGRDGLALMWRHRLLTGVVGTTISGRNAHDLDDLLQLFQRDS